jgi:hypothetical protein
MVFRPFGRPFLIKNARDRLGAPGSSYYAPDTMTDEIRKLASAARTPSASTVSPDAHNIVSGLLMADPIVARRHGRALAAAAMLRYQG